MSVSTERAASPQSDTELIPQAPPRAATGLAALTRGQANALTWSLVLLTLFATFTVLYVAQAVFVPIVLAALIQTALTPIVRLAGRVGIGPPIAASLLLVLTVAAGIAAVYYLAAPTREWVETLPNQLTEVRSKLRGALEDVERVAEAGRSLDEMTDLSDEGTVPARVSPVGGSPLLAGTTTLIAQAFATLLLLFAMIASQGGFLRSLVRVLPDLHEKRMAVTVVHEIGHDVSRYLLTVTLINAGLGCAIGATMWLLGMPNPILWGTMAAVFNFVPYAGAIAGICVVGLAATAAFEGLAKPLFTMGLYLAWTSLEGGILTPMIVGHGLRLRAVVVLIWLLLWSFLWGLIGALIAIPILVVLKILCERVPSLHGLGVFLGQMDEPAARQGQEAAAGEAGV